MMAQSNTTIPKPRPGTPAYIKWGRTRTAVTVDSVSPSGHQLFVRIAKATPVIEDEIHGDYLYEPDPRGTKHLCTLREDGSYKIAGHAFKKLVLGEYQTMIDPEEVSGTIPKLKL
jgi:hypothetical protein